MTRKADFVAVMAMALASMRSMAAEFAGLYRSERDYNNILHKHRKHRRGKPK